MRREVHRQLTYVGVVLTRSVRDIKSGDLASTSITDGVNYTVLSAKTYSQVR
jgi:hypothetical protein